MICPHCTNGKVRLFTTVRACEKCGGTGMGAKALLLKGIFDQQHRAHLALKGSQYFHRIAAVGGVKLDGNCVVHRDSPADIADAEEALRRLNDPKEVPVPLDLAMTELGSLVGSFPSDYELQRRALAMFGIPSHLLSVDRGTSPLQPMLTEMLKERREVDRRFATAADLAGSGFSALEMADRELSILLPKLDLSGGLYTLETMTVGGTCHAAVTTYPSVAQSICADNGLKLELDDLKLFKRFRIASRATNIGKVGGRPPSTADKFRPSPLTRI